MITGNMEHGHPSIFTWVPLKLVITPELFHPQVCCHYLTFQILKKLCILNIYVCKAIAINLSVYSFIHITEYYI